MEIYIKKNGDGLNGINKEIILEIEKKINVKIKCNKKYCGCFENGEYKNCPFQRFHRWYLHGRSESRLLPKPEECWDYSCGLYPVGIDNSTILDKKKVKDDFRAMRCLQCMKDFGVKE